MYHLIILIYIRKSPPPPQPYDHHDHHNAHGDEDAGDVKMIAVVIQFLPVIAPASSLGPDNHSPSYEVADLGDDDDDGGNLDDEDNYYVLNDVKHQQKTTLKGLCGPNQNCFPLL